MLKVQTINFAYIQPIIQDLSFTVSQGDWFVIQGSNGSGKTTILKLLAGLLQPQCGLILFQGKPLKKYWPWQRSKICGVVLNIFVAPHQEKVQQYLNVRKYPEAKKLLQELGLAGFESRIVKTLSGGELQRLMIIKALLPRPRVLIMDEPVNHLDPKQQIQVLRWLKQYTKKHKQSVVAVLHDENLAQIYGDHVLVLK